jgi:murein L,D-transpeptidase YcbB/YkuD
MRRAALCLLSSLAFAAASPAVAQDTAQAVQPAPEPSAADPAALTPKTRAEGDANVSAPAAPAVASEPAPAVETQAATSPAAPASDPIATSSIPDAKPASPAVPAASETPAAPAAQDTASPSAPAATPPASETPAPATATPTPPPVPTPPVAAPAEPPLPPLNAALLAALESSQPNARQTQDREWHEAVTAFYAARKGLPVWTTDGGLNTAALALSAEIGRADDWGLDPKAFDLTGLPTGGATPEALAAAELKLTRALVTYAWHARGGRVDPSQLSKWLDQSPRPLDVKALLEQFASVSDPSIALQKLHPQHRQFELLRQAYLKARGIKTEAPQEDPRNVTIPSGPVVRLGERHEHVELVRRRLEVPARSPDEADLYDEDVAAAVRQFLGATYRDSRTGKTVKRPAHPALTNATRTSLSRKIQQASESRQPTLQQYLVNLERWRWLPEQLGATHIWNNLPEYVTRVIRNGAVIHQERIIIGKPTNQTPVFSDEMEFVVFHPDWGVPGTIKVQDLLPSLQAGDDSVLQRRNMRLVSGNRTVHPAEIDWSRTDIRKLSVIQDPGPSNPLGQLKFMFPNKHDVYMHDTPTKQLFETPVRAYSFGCIRVRNPVRLAELVFGQDRNWTQTDIAPLLSPRAQQNNRVDLNRRIPVHNTYFTLLADEHGKVTSFADVYGHDRRIQAVLLEGQRPDVVARTDPALALERKVKELAANPPSPRGDGYGNSWGGWGGGGGGPAAGAGSPRPRRWQQRLLLWDLRELIGSVRPQPDAAGA